MRISAFRSEPDELASAGRPVLSSVTGSAGREQVTGSRTLDNTADGARWRQRQKAAGPDRDITTSVVVWSFFPYLGFVTKMW